jgi:hypothetical protein
MPPLEPPPRLDSDRAELACLEPDFEAGWDELVNVQHLAAGAEALRELPAAPLDDEAGAARHHAEGARLLLEARLSRLERRAPGDEPAASADDGLSVFRVSAAASVVERVRGDLADPEKVRRRRGQT